jgi:hypothetical protein
MFRSSLLSVLLLLGISNTLAAREPAEDQRAAIRAACRSDFVANCAGVQPRSKAALECLIGNEAKLSTACRSAVSAITARPTARDQVVPTAKPGAPARAAPAAADAPALAPSVEVMSNADRLNAVRQVCTLNDFIAHCPRLQPTSPEILVCLQAKSAELSPACRAVVVSPPAGQTPTAAEAQPAEAAPPAAAVPSWCGRICR